MKGVIGVAALPLSRGALVGVESPGPTVNGVFGVAALPLSRGSLSGDCVAASARPFSLRADVLLRIFLFLFRSPEVREESMLPESGDVGEGTNASLEPDEQTVRNNGSRGLRNNGSLAMAREQVPSCAK